MRQSCSGYSSMNFSLLSNKFVTIEDKTVVSLWLFCLTSDKKLIIFWDLTDLSTSTDLHLSILTELLTICQPLRLDRVTSTEPIITAPNYVDFKQHLHLGYYSSSSLLSHYGLSQCSKMEIVPKLLFHGNSLQSISTERKVGHPPRQEFHWGFFIYTKECQSYHTFHSFLTTLIQAQ